MGEHRLTKHGLAQSHAIQASYELAIDPRLDAVGVASSVQMCVGFNHVGHYPGASLAFALQG